MTKGFSKLNRFVTSKPRVDNHLYRLDKCLSAWTYGCPTSDEKNVGNWNFFQYPKFKF